MTKQQIYIFDDDRQQREIENIYQELRKISAAGGGVDSVFGRTGTVVAATDDYTWGQIDKTTSSIGDITTKSHTLLDDIGSNTHAQIDTHVDGDGSDHSDVALNNTHRTSNGTDHSYINQDVKTTSSPTFIDPTTETINFNTSWSGAEQDGRVAWNTGSLLSKISYVFDDIVERDAFFAIYPSLLIEDALIVIKDTTPPPTPGVRSYDFSIAYNSQYKLTAI